MTQDDLEFERTKRRVAASLLGAKYEPVRMGRFAILRLVGEGGMGQVHAAYDERLDRRVALKVIHADRVNSPVARERLRREARAMARLSHPNVVQLYEDGQQDDQTFLALEFVDGPTLAQWLAEDHPVSEILDVFLMIGEGLAAAHAADVVHRDFKPENVLFAKDGTPKVADFGLAVLGKHVTEPALGDAALGDAALGDAALGDAAETRLTQTGYQAGTPMFMSPEQWAGDATDARTDQFSYCQTLYRALYGQDPFEGTTVTARRKALKGPPRPAPTGGRVPRWLWRPIERGLSRDPAGRFPDMPALLAALRADPRKRRRRVAAVVGVGLLGVGALAFSPLRDRLAIGDCVVAADRIETVWNEERAAAAKAAFEAFDVPYVSQRWPRVRAAGDRYAASWRAARLEGCVMSRVDKTMPPTLVPRSEECFESHLLRLDVTVRGLASASLAVADQTAGVIRSLPSPKDCNATKHLAERPELPESPETRAEIRAIRRGLREASMRNWDGDSAGAIEDANAMLKRARATGWRPLVAHAHGVIGELYTAAWDGEQASAAFRAEYRVAASVGDEVAALQAISGLMGILTDVMARPEEALWWYQIAEPAIARLGLDVHPDVAYLLRSYAGAHHALGHYDEALRAYERAHDIVRTVYGEESTVAAALLGDLGDTHLRRGDVPAAIDTFEAQRQASLATHGPNHPDFAIPLINLGAAHAELGKLELAFKWYTEALQLIEGAYGPDDIRSSPVHNNIGLVLIDRGQLDAARVSIEKSLVLREKWFGPDHPQVGSSVMSLGRLEEKNGQETRALAHFERAHAIFAKSDPTGGRALEALEARATMHRRLGELDRAQALEAEVVALSATPAETP